MDPGAPINVAGPFQETSLSGRPDHQGPGAGGREDGRGDGALSSVRRREGEGSEGVLERPEGVSLAVM